MSVAENLRSIRANIERAGRGPDEITVVAVTKGFGADACREAIDAGLTILGENRVQEGLDKMRAVTGAQWHLIGHLQSNKSKKAAELFQTIQTVDSAKLARRLNVSRSPVREAVLGLVAQGLAVEQPRRGVVVATVDPADLKAIHEMRMFLEAGAAHCDSRRR